MASRYYPPSQRFYGKYTIGKLYSLPGGEEYIGPYHFFGARELVMTGAYPNDNSVVLMPWKKQIQHADIFAYDRLTQLNLREFKSPKARKPKPGPNDETNGYMIRYFIKLRNDDTSVPMEIDLKQYEDVMDNDANNIDGFRFDRISLRWKISGPQYDQYHDKDKKSIKAYGVADTNRRTVFQKNMKMSGLITVLGDLSEHSRYSQIRGESAAGLQTTNLHTDGDAFVLPDGTPYIGYYHIHPTKGPHTGKTHSEKVHQTKLMTEQQYKIAAAHGTLGESGDTGNIGYN